MIVYSEKVIGQPINSWDYNELIDYLVNVSGILAYEDGNLVPAGGCKLDCGGYCARDYSHANFDIAED